VEPQHTTLAHDYDALRSLALAWRAADPDPDTQFEVELLLAAGDHPGLEDRFGHRLTFGSGGMRGEMGAGPNRMNRVVVRQLTRALMLSMNEFGVESPVVVIGYDARNKSRSFAEEVEATVAALGGQPYRVPKPLPTPVLAFAVRHLRADAGVMITASHNTANDNGCKVYGPGGSLLVPPADERLVELMASLDLPPRAGVAAVHSGAADHRLPAGDDLIGAYLDATIGDLRPDAVVAGLRVVYTPLHGTALEPMLRACARLGVSPTVVPAQTETDPATWTVERPNPEEAVSFEAALRLARVHDADVVLAHDADGDRLGVAIPTATGYRRLTGDEIGLLLAEHLLSAGVGDDRLVVSTVVSSSMLAKIASAHGVHHARTLPGIRWVLDAARRRPEQRLVFAYEEALGYVTSGAVHDKDGIVAAVRLLQLLGSLRRQGRTLEDALGDLDARYGVHLTTQIAVRYPGLGGRTRLLARLDALRDHPPAEVGGVPVQAVLDHRAGAHGLPATNLVELRFDACDGARVLLRPSETESMLKIYVELVAGRGDRRAAPALESLAHDVRALVLRSGS
jgi:phosphomannomutase